MNKFFVVFLLFLVSVKAQDTTEDTIYAAVVALFKGLAETEEAKCSAVLVNQKEKILEIVHAAIDEVKAGTAVETAIQNAAMKLMGVDGLVSECNVLAMPAIINKFTDKTELVGVFQTLIDNIDEVFAYGENIRDCIKNKDYNGAAENAGHILSIALDFQVNL